MEHFDVVVVGAGILGAACAAEVARRGARTLILDGAPRLCADNATSASWAWLNANAKSPRHYKELNKEGMRLWAEMERSPAVVSGAVVVGDESPFDPDYPSERLARPESFDAAIRMPAEIAISAPSVRLYRQEGLMDPVAGVARLVGEAEAHGATLALGEPVLRLAPHPDGGAQIETARRALRASRVLLAAGTATAALAAQLGAGPADVPLLRKPGVLVWTRPLPPGTLRALLVTPQVYMHQRPCGRFVIGVGVATATAPKPAGGGGGGVGGGGDGGGGGGGGGGGVAAGGGAGAPPPAPPARDAAAATPAAEDTSFEHCARAISMAAEWVPALRAAAPERATLGFRPYPADGLPVVGFLGARPGGVAAGVAYVCVAHSAVTLAPALARHVGAELLAGRAVAESALAPYRPGRAALAVARGAYDVQMDGVRGAARPEARAGASSKL